MWKAFSFVLLLSAVAAAEAAPAPGSAPHTHHYKVGAILVMGDSISAGYGIDINRGWVALLRSRLKATGYTDKVVNASVSGETTRGGLTRLPRALRRDHPTIVIIELGGNDGLRGLSLKAMKRNLAKMIHLSRQKGARVLLLGMRLPPNYGTSYTDAFAAVYPRLAHRYNVPLVPFLLAGVATDRSKMQAGGLHPKARAEPRLLNNVWPKLVPLLRSAKGIH